MTLRDIGDWFSSVTSEFKSDLTLIRDGASIVDWPLYILIPAAAIAVFLAGVVVCLLGEVFRRHFNSETMSPRTRVGLFGAQLFLGAVWLLRTLILWLLIFCIIGIPFLGLLSGPDIVTLALLYALLGVSLLLAIILPLKPWRRWRKER